MKRIALCLLAILLPLRAAALCELVKVAPEGSIVSFPVGPFTTEDEITPVTPATIVFSVYRTGGKPTTAADELLAPVTLTSPADFNSEYATLRIPAAANVVVKTGATKESHTLTIEWTWAGCHAGFGTPCVGTKQCTFNVERLPFLP